ncbi:MAG: thiamine pyrophosphate-dependent enzyme, partial [Myxococcales bacterium]
MASKLISDNLPFVEEQYARFLTDENAVDPEWREYFHGLGDRIKAFPTPEFQPRSIFAPRLVPAAAITPDAASTAHAVKQDRVAQLVQAYRWRGHLFAKLDPLGLQQRRKPDIELADFGLSEADLDTPFTAGGLRGTLRELIAHLEETYCRTIGVETAHIEDMRIRDWLRERMEATRNHLDLSREDQVHLLTKLTDAESFENFLKTKFIGAKRFSVEGGESLIPLVDRIVERCARQGVVEMVIGMAHRGRLNVLANVLNMPTRQLFAEFLDEDPNVYLGKGDVKYHLGHSSDREVDGKNIHLSLSFNPSHLEFVDAVVMGRVRAKQDRRLDPNRRKVVSLLIHGDAAFAGQGIIAELFNMAELPGYNIGGTIHVIVNNQVGFTTNPSDARSTRYATDVAKMLGIPIFHVNGEDPEAVAQVVNLATDFRLTFNRDVVIDLYCYRKLGHNEGDEPAYTQPLMYEAIARHPSVREQFVKKLISMGEITQEQADQIAAERRQKLEDELTETKKGYQRKPPSAMAGLWSRYAGGKDKDTADVSTG